MNCKSFLTSLDFISNEVKLTIHQRKTRLKTLLGGLLSITSVLVMLGFGLYFFIKFLQKDSLYVTSSMKYSENTTIIDSNYFPFLIRLTDKENKPFANAKSIYTIHLKYWYSQEMNSNFQQSNEDILIEPCDLDKHFSHFRYLFVDIADLSTFYCAVPRPLNRTIFGKYGDLTPFGYYHFYVTKCWNDPGCRSAEEIEDITENIYLDFRTIDYSMDSYKQHAKNSTILSHRHMLSNTVYKRIWFYLSEVDYITDDGLFFASESTDYFSKFDSMKYDIDLRDMTVGTIPGTFATMTILSSGTIYIYNRKYLKIQEYLASVGGIIAFVQEMTLLLNLLYSTNNYYLHFMDELNIFCTETKNETETLDKSNHQLVNTRHNALVNKIPIIKPRSQLDLRGMKMESLVKKKMNKWYFRLIPFQCHPKKEAEFFSKCVDKICALMNVSAIIKKIEENQLFAKSVYMDNSNKIHYSEILLSNNFPMRLHPGNTVFERDRSEFNAKEK